METGNRTPISTQMFPIAIYGPDHLAITENETPFGTYAEYGPCPCYYYYFFLSRIFLYIIVIVTKRPPSTLRMGFRVVPPSYVFQFFFFFQRIIAMNRSIK